MCYFPRKREKDSERFRYVENKFNLHCEEKQIDDIGQFRRLINFPTGICFESKQFLTVLVKSKKLSVVYLSHSVLPVTTVLQMD